MSIIKNKRILIPIILAVLVLGFGLIYFVTDGFSGSEASQETGSGQQGDINYNPPTEEELQDVERRKDEIVSENTGNDTTTDSSSGSKRSVSPFISVAQQFNDSQYGNRVEVRAYITGIIESGGKCNVEFTKGSQKVTWKVDATPDANSTNCDVIMVPRSEFPSAGTWNTVVKYNSSKAAGTSDSVKVKVE